MLPRALPPQMRLGWGCGGSAVAAPELRSDLVAEEQGRNPARSRGERERSWRVALLRGGGHLGGLGPSTVCALG